MTTGARALGVLLACATGSSLFPAVPAHAGHRAVPWPPEPGATWQIQFEGTLDRSVDVDVYDIDMFETRPKAVRSLHRRGRRVICYVNAGAWERWRPDRDRFPDRVIGKPLDDWPGERWLDARRRKALRPLLDRRAKRCARKGFDGIEWDNVDGYTHETGFPIRARHQRRFNRMLARISHRHGLAAGLKNDLAQVRHLEPFFDFAVVEQCWQFRECRRLDPFLEAGKAVFEIEYRGRRSDFCPRANRRGISTVKKRRELDAWRRPCRS